MNLTIYSAFESVPDSVAQALRFPVIARFQLSWQWFRTLYDTALRSEGEPRIFVVSDRNDAVIGALFCIQRKGRVLSSMTNFYSLEFGMSSSAGEQAQKEALELIVERIAEDHWHCVELRLLVEGGTFDSDLARLLGKHGFAVEHFFQYHNWIRRQTAKAESFDEYYDARPSRLKNTIKRKSKKLYADHDVTLSIVTGAEGDLARAIADYTVVYNRSWKEPEPYVDFIPSMLRSAASEGALALGVLYLADRPAAAQIWLLENDRSVIYKLAYDEDFKTESVGSMLSRELFRYVFEHGHAGEIDYGVGNEAYKRDWMEQCQQLVGIRALNRRTLIGRLAILGAMLKARLKRLLRRPAEDSDQ